MVLRPASNRSCQATGDTQRLWQINRSSRQAIPLSHAESVQVARLPSDSSQYQTTKIDTDERDNRAGLEVSCRIRSAGDGTHGAVGFKGNVGAPALQAGQRTGSV